jgi:alkaline phosphatase
VELRHYFKPGKISTSGLDYLKGDRYVQKGRCGISTFGHYVSRGNLRGGNKVHSEEHETAHGKVKNVTYLIRGGYSEVYATNYRWYKGEESVFGPSKK